MALTIEKWVDSARLTDLLMKLDSKSVGDVYVRLIRDTSDPKQMK
jgi:hypothetical protein